MPWRQASVEVQILRGWPTSVYVCESQSLWLCFVAPKWKMGKENSWTRLCRWLAAKSIVCASHARALTVYLIPDGKNDLKKFMLVAIRFSGRFFLPLSVWKGMRHASATKKFAATCGKPLKYIYSEWMSSEWARVNECILCTFHGSRSGGIGGRRWQQQLSCSLHTLYLRKFTWLKRETFSSSVPLSDVVVVVAAKKFCTNHPSAHCTTTTSSSSCCYNFAASSQ